MESAKAVLGLIMQGSMFLIIMALAMETNWRHVVEQVRHPTAVIRGVIAVNVVVPLVAVILVHILPMERVVAAGMVLMAVSPLAPLVPGTAVKTGARRSAVMAFYLVLIILAIPLVPLTVMLLNEIFGTRAVAPVAVVAKVVLISAVIPILLGLALGALLPQFSQRAAKILTILSYIALLLGILVLLWAAGGTMLAMFGNWTIVAFFLTASSGILAGHLLAKDPTNRGAMAVAAATRHPGIAGAIAHASGTDPRAMIAAILFLLNGVIVSSLYQAWLRRHPEALAPASDDQNSTTVTPL